MVDDAGTHFLTYGLFSNALRTTVWGNDSDHGVIHNGDGTATDINVYGKMAGGQNKPIGSYHDTVVATVSF